MEVRTLYRYEREDGGMDVSPNKPDCQYTELFRIIADEGHVVTEDGENLYYCVDVEYIDGWYEIEEPEKPEEESEKEIEELNE